MMPVNFKRSVHKLAIGESTERIKKEIGCRIHNGDGKTLTVKGRDLITAYQERLLYQRDKLL